jgi:Glucodextranase, domain B
MMGLPGQLPAAPRPVDPAPKPTPTQPDAAKLDAGKQAVPQKTILGMTSPFVSGVPQPLHGAKVAPLSAAEKAEAGKGTGPASATFKPVKPDESAAAVPSANRTMLGVAPPASVAQAIREANAKSQESAAGEGPQAKKTMVGMAAPPAAELVTPPRVSAVPPLPPGDKLSAQSDRTMLGMPAAPLPAKAPEPPPFSTTLHGESMPELPGAGSSRTVRAVLAALAGALLMLGLGLAAWHYLSAPALALRVVQTDQGESLEIDVPDAEPGSKVRFLGAEQELRAGKASFPLTAEALALGDNELSIGVVQAGDTQNHTVRLHVAYRARAELAGLSADPASLSVVIDALPGSKVTLDGQPLALDGKGHGQKQYPLLPEPANKLAFSARYRVEPKGGAAAEGALQLSLPVASLQIDRPGASVTTDQASVEVAGAVESGAKVTVDGNAVKVSQGRFLSRVKLAKTGVTTVRVVASVPGKVARSAELQVERVADLEQAAAGFKADSALTYARIAQNPVIYRGQNVAIEGRVYNVEVKAGASHLQMLARDCPSQRCPLWVELPQATDATVDSWVRVLGQVAGEQQFRSERNQVHTVPSVRAQYVLKLPR